MKAGQGAPNGFGPGNDEERAFSRHSVYCLFVRRKRRVEEEVVKDRGVGFGVGCVGAGHEDCFYLFLVFLKGL